MSSKNSNTKVAYLPPGVSRFSPSGVAALVEHLRGASGGGPSHAQRAVNWAQPGLDAAHNAHGDYKLIYNALNKSVPGAGRKFEKYLSRGAHSLADVAEDTAHRYGPGVLDRVGGMVDAARQRYGAPTRSAPWYHDPASAVGAGLGVAGLAGLGAMGAKRLMDRHHEDQENTDPQMYTALNKISMALDLIADEIDSRPVAQIEEKTAEASEIADVFGNFSAFYRQQVGEDLPAALAEKLAQDADGETVAALQKLVKSAAMERPTPLGEPSDGGGYRNPPSTRGEASKVAWEQFEETLLNYEGA